MVVTNIFVGQEQRHRRSEQTYGHGVGVEESGKNWKSSTDIYTLPCVKQITNKDILYTMRNSPQYSVLTRI